MTEQDGNDNLNNDNGADAGAPQQPAATTPPRADLNRVVSYKDATDDMRAEMELLMQPIDENPADFDTIIDYGHEPLKEIGDVGRRMVSVQSGFASQVKVFDSDIDKLQKGMSAAGFEKLGEITKRMFEGIGQAGAKGVKGGFKLGKGMWEALTGAKSKRTEEEQFIASMEEELPKMLEEMLKLVANIAKTEEAIVEVIHSAQELGKAQVGAFRKLNLYIGAGEEVVRRYDEEYIPEAKEKAEASFDMTDEMYLQDLIDRRTDFVEHLARLESSRLQSMNSVVQTREIIRAMQEQRKKMRSILHNGQHEWMVMLASAGFAGSSLKSAQINKKADEFGDKLHDTTLQMVEEAHRMTLESATRGTVDHKKMIEAAGRMRKLLESTAQRDERATKELESRVAMVRDAADKLLEASETINKRKTEMQLEGSKRGGKGLANDNKGGAAASRAAKRQGDAPVKK